MKLNELEDGAQKVVKAIITAYINVYGVEKWNSLTDDQKHDVIMTIAKDVANRLTSR